MKPLIQLQSAGFAYANRPALFDQLDLAIHAGELVGLIGANGSGKTSLLRLFIGLHAPTSGRLIAFETERRTNAERQELWRRIGYLFQDSQDQLFNPTVRDDVAFGPLNLGHGAEQAAEIARQTLERLGLTHLAASSSHQLSGGEKRLVALATILAMQPEVLLLDEPTSGLDPRSRRELVEHLARIGNTQVIASHDMEFIRATCRRVVVLRQGEIVADGATDDVLSRASLMFESGLEVPHSLAAERNLASDHHHGAGPSHGHGYRDDHHASEHTPER